MSMMVRIEAKADHVDAVKACLLGILEPTRKEEGCVNYQLYIDDANPLVFIFVETWATKAHWEAHDKAPHVDDFRKLAATAVAGVEVVFMSEHGAA